MQPEISPVFNLKTPFWKAKGVAGSKLLGNPFDSLEGVKYNLIVLVDPDCGLRSNPPEGTDEH